MSVGIDIGWLAAVLLISARVAGATALIPVLGPMQVPVTVRIVLIAGLAVLFVGAMPTTVHQLTSLSQLTIALLGELLIGASLAFGFMAAYAATQLAGRVLDIQIGFSAASVMNPATQTVAPLLGSVIGMAAIAVFLSMDGHHVLIEALAASVRTLPPGVFPRAFAWDAFMRQSSAMFVFGLALAAPVMLILLLVDGAVAIFARSMPQLNVLILSFSLKIIVGLLAFAAAIPFARQLIHALFNSAFEYWDQVVTGS